MRSQLFGKDPDAGKDGRQTEKGAAEDERVRQCHRLDKHAFEQTPGDSEGQGGLQNAGHDLATEQRITIRHLRVVIDTAVLETHLVQPVFQELHAAFSTGFPETQTQTHTHQRSCFCVNEKLYWPRATEIYSSMEKYVADSLNPEVLPEPEPPLPRGDALNLKPVRSPRVTHIHAQARAGACAVDHRAHPSRTADAALSLGSEPADCPLIQPTAY